MIGKPTMEKEKTYPVTTVAIQNRVTECFKSMSIDEKRILILSSPIARNRDATERDEIFISTQDFAKECGIKTNSAYKQLEVASKRLIDRSFSYINQRDRRVRSNWVIDATYEDAGVSLRFTSIVLEMLKILDEFNPYTRYRKEVVLKLKKDYAIDFYHLAKKNQKLGGFKLTIDEAFVEFGLPESYRDLSNFKRRVLKVPIDEINAVTDLCIGYTPVKQGRTVIAYQFTVKEKPKPKTVKQERDPNTLDLFCHMTDKQISTYSSILSESKKINDLAGTMSYSAFAIWLASVLRDPSSVREETAKRVFKALRTETDFKG
ncbi:replication initiation protein [Acinetobacter junii]|jgi:plasmid replication initiation protein|uniref:replication initiation protein n=1 Tax=Acinetobacter junii TaxID=40215 RepID=UPI0035B65027